MNRTRATGRAARAVAALSITVAVSAALAPSAQADTDSFYTYSGGAPLSSIEPGTVLKTRTMPYHVAGVAIPVTAVQLVYRTTDAQGRPTTNVTSVLKPPTGVDPRRAVAYQSFYDSMNPADSPSRAIAGDVSFGGAVNASEAQFLAVLLAQGYSVIVADTEGQKANFAAGPEYGKSTLDSIRAATRSHETDLNSGTRVGLFGYSGGAIATNWAAALAPGYAPDVNRNLVGAAEGGVLVNPARNLTYVSGSTSWSGVAVMAIAGVARAYDIDFTDYLSDRGRQLVDGVQGAGIGSVLGRYPGLTWQQMVKPEYADPASVTPFMTAAAKVNLGEAPTPTIPMFIGQGANGVLEGTAGDKPNVGPGDGVMVAGDVRALARQYCASGNSQIQYTQYDGLSHVMTMAPWAPEAFRWLGDRFAGAPAPSNCGSIPPGNSLVTQP
ncbi:triacylglycerol lipase [Rhodococcus spelaei]|uniref:Triacylglycerol lipase n=1 Tax=Rhodococcus spelaei TaxID=2546320 RepID=A0A541B0I5_9NOCA|nr:triacylglycerol lipase [Rhodococcus spelaei]